MDDGPLCPHGSPISVYDYLNGIQRAMKMSGLFRILLSVLALGLAGNATAQTVEYIHTDALGSMVAVTDANGNVIERREYEPYGSQLSPVVQDGPGYTGHVQDSATGLIYMQQRYYDAAIGAMLSVDPVTAYEKPVTNFCRYCYARNNPYRFTDPDGRDSVGEMIDANAMAAASRGNSVATYGWAFAGATWKTFGAEGISQIADKGLEGSSTGEKLGAGLEVASVIPLGRLVGEAGAAIKGGIELTAEQAKNVERFASKLPANAKETVTLKELPNGGVAAQGTSAGRVPGSSAVYEKQIDSTGKTVQYTKTTYGPAGNVVNVKDKITGSEYKP